MIGLAQQQSILARVEKLRQENPALLALIEQLQGFRFPEVAPPSRPGERKRVVFARQPRAQTRPVVKSAVGFPGWSDLPEGDVKRKRRSVKIVPRTSTPWRRSLNISLTPTLLLMLNKTKRQRIDMTGGGGGDPALQLERVTTAPPVLDNLRVTEAGDTRVTEAGDFRVLEDG